MLERILVGVDGSTQAAGAEAWAARLAQDLGAWLVVASVWRPSRPELPEAEARVERDQALHLLQDSWAQPAHLGTDPVESVLLDGDSPDALLDDADRIDADLVVVGTRGRGGFAGLRMGSFSDYVTHRTTRPLAVIPADAEPGVSRIVVGLDGSEGYPWVVGLCACAGGTARCRRDRRVRGPPAPQLAGTTTGRLGRAGADRGSTVGPRRCATPASPSTRGSSRPTTPLTPCSRSPAR